MARFRGVLGYVETVETAPSVFTEVVTERIYRGDELRDSRSLESSVGTNDNIQIRNRLSIVADAYAETKFYAIRYVNWRGTRWKVESAEVQHPRLILTIGGLYNGPTAN